MKRCSSDGETCAGYGVRLLPTDELESFEEAKIKLQNGNTAGVTMHLIEGDSRGGT